jgi:hypothetical protein
LPEATFHFAIGCPKELRSVADEIKDLAERVVSIEILQFPFDE